MIDLIHMKFILFFLLPTTVLAYNPNQDQDMVVLIHGYSKNARDMRNINTWLKASGYITHTVEYRSINRTLDQVKGEVFSKFDSCCLNSLERVHFVGHSLGGLLIRSYLGERDVSKLGRVVIIGSPNRGLELFNGFNQKFVRNVSPILAEIMFENSNFLSSLEAPYYELGVISGDKNFGLLNEIEFLADSDGLVSVESSKVDGMKDFVLVNTIHGKLVHTQATLNYVVNFLQTGNF